MQIKIFDNRYGIVTLLQVLCVASLAYLTLMPVEERWAEADILLACMVPALCGVGAVGLILGKGRMGITVTDMLIVAWFAYYVGRTWVGADYPCRTEFLKGTVMFLLYGTLRMVFGGRQLSGWVLTGALLVCGCYEALSGIAQMVNGTSRHGVYLLTGNFQNPGPYSAYLMMGIAAGLAALCPSCSYRKARWPVMLSVAVMAIVLPATWSRAAFLGVAIAALWICRRYYWKYRYAVWGSLLLAALLFYYIKQGSADGRIIIWRAALAAWQDAPWLGVGTDGFCHAVAGGMARLHDGGMDLSSAGVTDNAYNILLKILVEQGIVGVAFAVALCASVLPVLYRNGRPQFYAMLSLLVFSMFSYPFDLLPYNIIAVMMVAWSESVGGRTLSGTGRVVPLLLAVCLAVAGWQTCRLVRESREADEGYGLIRGICDEAFTRDYYELLPMEGDNANFLFDFGKILRQSGRYNDSNAMLSQGTQCSADPMFYVLIGNNYRDMRLYGLAEQAYRRAFAVMPNRLYPLYQLMLMYDEMGDGNGAKAMAKRIIEMKPKIESPATREMKEKAQRLLLY